MLCLGLSVAMGLDIKQNFVVPCVQSHKFLVENVLPQGYLVGFHAIALHVKLSSMQACKPLGPLDLYNDYSVTSFEFTHGEYNFPWPEQIEVASLDLCD